MKLTNEQEKKLQEVAAFLGEQRQKLIDLISKADPAKESYFTCDPDNGDDPSDYYTGNADDDLQHGYDAGYNDALIDVLRIIEKV